MQRTNTLVVFEAMAFSAASAFGQCQIDADGDGHPLFQSLNRRVDLEFIDEQSMIARPTDMAFGDLDGDGDYDGAFAMSGGGIGNIDVKTYMTVALNRGDGVFDPPTPYFGGREVCGVALGDVDGDGDLDIGVTNAIDDTVSVFLNNGDATFGPEAVYPVGAMPRSLCMVDLNGDGLADMAVLNVESEDVSVLIAVGAGAFAPEVRVDVGVVSPRPNLNETFPVPGPFFAASDLDADGDVDLVIPSEDEISILRNNAGAFTLDAVTVPIGAKDANDIVAADFNGDGRTDLAAIAVVGVGDATKALSVMLQLDDGSWSDAAVYSANFLDSGIGQFYLFLSLDAGDIDDDGDVDLVVGEANYEFVGVYENNGDGLFKDFDLHTTYQGPWVVKLKDVTHDGLLDLVHLQGGPGRRPMRIHPGDGAGGFISMTRSPEAGELECASQNTMDGADFDSDGDLDLIMGLGEANCATQVRVRENHGDGTFGIGGEITLAPAGEAMPVHTVVADLNGDGLPDVVVADDGTYDLVEDFPGAVWVLRGIGHLAFDEPFKLPLATNPWHLATGDFDGDGDTDVAASTSDTHPGDAFSPVARYVEILLNDGNGGLSAGQTITLDGDYPTEFHAGVVEAADLDGDGDVDLVATVGSKLEPGRIVTLLNKGDATYTVGIDNPVGWQPSSLALRDFDSDGDIDVAVMFHHGNSTEEAKLEPYLKIYHNDGASGLTLAQEILDVSILNRWDMEAGDFNLDGYPDLAMPTVWGSIIVHLNNTDGTFGAGVGYDLLANPGAQAHAIGDFDGDGRPDIACAALTADGVLMLLPNKSCPPCPADINADGTLNILDFVAFQLLWQDADPAADCDASGDFDVLDFACFQQEFVSGCP
jgi:hypothetical protein